jgi:hypothetical protein
MIQKTIENLKKQWISSGNPISPTAEISIGQADLAWPIDKNNLSQYLLQRLLIGLDNLSQLFLFKGSGQEKALVL